MLNRTKEMRRSFFRPDSDVTRTLRKGRVIRITEDTKVEVEGNDGQLYEVRLGKGVELHLEQDIEVDYWSISKGLEKELR